MKNRVQERFLTVRKIATRHGWKYGYRQFLSVSLALTLSSGALAVTPVSDQQGWSGYLMLGAGYTDVESNTVAGNDLIDGGPDTIGSIDDKPRSSDSTHAVAGAEIKYTLANRNQIFLGGSLEDQLTLDFATQLGWRKQTEKIGAFQASFLFSGIPVEVWEDPYLAGSRRSETDRDSSGVRFEWSSIMGSAFELTAQVREIDLDNELSGTDPGLDCDLNCQSMLDRNGDQYQLRLSYTFNWSGGHVFRPQIRYRREDRDGEAVARDAYALQLTYSYLSATWIVVANALYGESSFDKANPLYGIKQDADTLALDGSVLYRLPTESGRWQLIANAVWAESDSDIRFHDNKITQVSLGVIYNFGKMQGTR